MKCVVIFAFLAVWISSSDAYRCLRSSTCMSGVRFPPADSLSQEDLQRKCGLYKNAMACLNGALADCRRDESSHILTIGNLLDNIQTVRSLQREHCSSSNGNGSNGADTLKVSALILALVLAVFSFVL